MTEETKITLEDCLKGAFQALLRGDTDERDVLCGLAERAFADSGQETLPKDTDVLKNIKKVN